MQSHGMFIFKNLDGKPVSQANRISEFARLIKTRDDYQAIQEETQSGVSEIQGRRGSQEDRVSLGMLPDYAQIISQDEYRSILSSTTDILQKTIRQTGFDIEQGSTMCAVLIDGHYIYTANLGDSLAFLCVLDANGKVVQMDRLNLVLHHPLVESERNRILSINGSIEGNRLISNQDRFAALAVSRSFGDRFFEASGLSHEPDFYMDIAAIPHGGKAFVIVSCDGLTEGDLLKKSDIQSIIEKNQHLPSDEIAKILTAAAFDKGSSDNISVAVTSLHEGGQQRKYLAVFDGHGGDDVSEIASCIFDKVVTINIQELVLSKILENSITDSGLKVKLSGLLDRVNHIFSRLPVLAMSKDNSDSPAYFLEKNYQTYSDCLHYIITVLSHDIQMDSAAKIYPYLDAINNVIEFVDFVGEIQLIHSEFKFQRQEYVIEFPVYVIRELSQNINKAMNEARNGNDQVVKELHEEFKHKLDEIRDLYYTTRIILDIQKKYFAGCRIVESTNGKIWEVENIFKDINAFLRGWSTVSFADLMLIVNNKLQKLNDSITYKPMTGFISSFFHTDDRLKCDLQAALQQLEPLVNKYAPHDKIITSDPKRLTA